MGRFKKDQIWAAIMIVISIFLIDLGTNIPTGAVYPRGVLILTIVLGSITIFLSIRKSGVMQEVKSSFSLKTIIEHAFIILFPFIYFLLWEPVGFVISTMIFLITILLYQKVSLKTTILTAIISTAVMQYIFGSVFQVPLPVPEWLFGIIGKG